MYVAFWGVFESAYFESKGLLDKPLIAAQYNFLLNFCMRNRQDGGIHETEDGKKGYLSLIEPLACTMMSSTDDFLASLEVMRTADLLDYQHDGTDVFLIFDENKLKNILTEGVYSIYAKKLC